MAEYPELEFRLHQKERDHCQVEARFRNAPGSTAQDSQETFGTALVEFDPVALRECLSDPEEYGKRLGKLVLGASEIRTVFDGAKNATFAVEDEALRIRLFLNADDYALQPLRWETLRDPITGEPLCTSQRYLFSRYLASPEMRPIRRRRKTDLRALIVVANPPELQNASAGEKLLAAIDVPAELARARQALNGILQIQELVSGVTLTEIVHRLQAEFDILYLVCHGMLDATQPYLCLEDKVDGQHKWTSGKDFVEAIERLLVLPRLIVLASCQSAGNGVDTLDDREALRPLAQRLGAAGVPAVIAVQGNVQQRTIEKFMPRLFEELLVDGRIDRAVAEARFDIRDTIDFWSPVLFTRLSDGRLWYDSTATNFSKWPPLVRELNLGTCVPVLGPGVLETYFGSMRDFAHSWGRANQDPVSSMSSFDVPQVAQFITATQGESYCRGTYLKELANQLLHRFPTLEETTRITADDCDRDSKNLNKLLNAANLIVRTPQKLNLYDNLATLPCKYYFTATADNLLIESLKRNNRYPTKGGFEWWRDSVAFSRSGTDQESESEEHDTEHPLVYRLFGNFDNRDSLVLTEDNYFQYLFRMHANTFPNDHPLQGALTASTFLFLGFRPDDWGFRVLLQHFINSESIRLAGTRIQVAVQVDPDEGYGSDTAQTHRFLEEYFHRRWNDFEVYWGTAEDFLQDLNSRRK